MTHNGEEYEEIPVRKYGYSLPFGFETEEIPGGDYVPTGSKWLQRVGWAFTSAVFRVYEWLGSKLSGSRHLSWSHCYECGGQLEMNEFEQKTKFVPDGTMQTISNLPHLHISDLVPVDKKEK